MGLFPGSVDSKVRAVTYGRLPTHGRTKLALVLHSTETRGLPGYGDGIRAPHYTYFPARRKFYQHAEVEDGYVGTMKGHTTGGHGNCKAIQLEIVAYSNREIADRYDTGLWVGDFTDEQYADLSDFWVWVRDRYRLDDDVTPTPEIGWRSGTGSPDRLSDDEWEAFSGLTAHGAVPRNCVTADTLILCADLTWRPAGDLLVGDELIAFDEHQQTRGSTSLRKLRRTTVTHQGLQREPIMLVVASDGTQVRTTYNHPWLIHRPSRNHAQGRTSWIWVKTQNLRPGDRLHPTFDVWQTERSYDAGWLAGMYDGEGSLTVSDRGVHLLNGQRVSPTADALLIAIKARADKVSVRVRIREGRQDFVQIAIQDRKQAIRMLGSIRPERLLAKADTVWEGAHLGKLAQGTNVTVESVESYGTGTIASLTTESHTYIAAGFAMHNSHWDTGILDLERIAEGGNVYKQFVEGIVTGYAEDVEKTRKEFERLYDAGILEGPSKRQTVDYWVGLLDDPANPEWLGFYARTELSVWGR